MYISSSTILAYRMVAYSAPLPPNNASWPIQPSKWNPVQIVQITNSNQTLLMY